MRPGVNKKRSERGLWNASLALSEKGFFAMAFLLSLFAAVAVQKNVRDLSYADRANADATAVADEG